MSSGPEDLEAQLAQWCASYVSAFSDFDSERIGTHWAFPSVIIHEGRRLVFNSVDQFSANTGALLTFYERQGVARANRKLVSCMSMTPEIASIRVNDEMVGRHGDVIVAWFAAYVLQKIDHSWKAILAVADGEAEAWKQRGTPLGS